MVTSKKCVACRALWPLVEPHCGKGSTSEADCSLKDDYYIWADWASFGTPVYSDFATLMAILVAGLCSVLYCILQ
jgi:multimeric flavodoxin WrbA